VLKEEGCNVLEKVDDSEYGKFAWVIDPEGNKVELWQPPPGQCADRTHRRSDPDRRVRATARAARRWCRSGTWPASRR
jgi:hypothetical protein